MNLFNDYRKKFLDFLKILEKKKIIILPKNLESISVELPSIEHKAHISCNAAMILSKHNKKSPLIIGEILGKILT